MITEDEFQTIADAVNNAVRVTATEIVQAHLADDDDNGTRLIAMIAGMISAAGVCCAGIEPTIDGNLLSQVVQKQFNDGRADARKMMAH